MPIYEYVCKECNKKFTCVLTITEYEKTVLACPKCKSRKVEQLPTAFFAVSSRKS
ncbi:MAG TPA: FmdB family zinc ribbon protein [Terriglobia bacterium]|nr:FmdB family zinc ribbon protein [Terriglobia bacterium]